MRKLRFGLWYDFRNPPQWHQDPARLYDSIIAQAVRAEALGWDDVWLSEHHFIEDGYTPSMPARAAISCAHQAGSHRHQRSAAAPSRSAAGSRGRCDDRHRRQWPLRPRGGRRYRDGEFRASPSRRRERDERMAEAMEVFRRCFSGERFTFEGKYYRYRDVQLFPQPVQKPMPLWLGGFLPKALRSAPAGSATVTFRSGRSDRWWIGASTPCEQADAIRSATRSRGASCG